MLTFVLIFFFAVFGILAYLISLKAKRRAGGPGRTTAPVAEHKVGRAVGSGDD